MGSIESRLPSLLGFCFCSFFRILAEVAWLRYEARHDKVVPPLSLNISHTHDAQNTRFIRDTHTRNRQLWRLFLPQEAKDPKRQIFMIRIISSFTHSCVITVNYDLSEPCQCNLHSHTVIAFFFNPSQAPGPGRSLQSST